MSFSIQISPLCVSPIPPSERPAHWFDRISARELWRLMTSLQVVMVSNPGTEFQETFRLVVPRGFVSDFASCPRAVQALLAEYSIKGPAAIVHDWLYFIGWPKAIADAVFFTLLKQQGARFFDRWAMYLAVEFFGGSAYNAHRRAGHPIADLSQAQTFRSAPVSGAAR